MQPRLHAAEFAPSTVSHGCMHGSSGVRKRSNPDIVLSNLLSLGHGKWVIAHHLGHLLDDFIHGILLLLDVVDAVHERLHGGPDGSARLTPSSVMPSPHASVLILTVEPRLV